MLKPWFSAGLVLSALIGFQAQVAAAPPQSGAMQLECKSQHATSPEARDPITTIKLSLANGNAQIIHVAQSGRTFNRAEQYAIKSALWADKQFAWSGASSKSPNMRMNGQLKPMTDDNKWFSYTETLVDSATGNKTYEMFSVCNAATLKTAAIVQPGETALPRSAQPKAGVISAAEEQIDSKVDF